MEASSLWKEIPHKVEISWEAKTKSDWTEKEVIIFDFVAKILNLHIKEKEEIVSDFYPRNVMLREDNTPVIIDMENPESECDLFSG